MTPENPNSSHISFSHSLQLKRLRTFKMSDAFQPAHPPKTELGRYRVLSSTAGIRVSPLQLGAMSIGDAWSKFTGSMSKEQSFELLDAF